MTDTDNDNLLNQFFKENKKEIEDFGFSRKVMRKLPDRGQRLANIWAAFCLGIAILLFFVFDGIDALCGLLGETFTTILNSEIANVSPTYLAIAAVVLVCIGIQKICSIE